MKKYTSITAKYHPSEIEAKWQKRWEEEALYQVKEKITGKKNYYCLVMFPYSSGDLHIGHWCNFAPADVFARFQRMQGKNVLHPIGFDAFGLPAEGAAIQRRVHPAVWTKKNIKKMIKQLKTVGTIYDWSRMVDTTDPSYYRWTQWMFLQMYKHSLAYKKKAMANWCPQCQSILANEQAEGGKCWRCEGPVEQREIEQWFFKITQYADQLLGDLGKLDWPQRTKIMQKNWIGKSEGCLINFKIQESKEQISVFTTRPDTIFGVTFFCLAPENPFVAELLKLKTQNSKLKINNEKIREYVRKARRKTELERIAEIKKKTGIFTGAYVLNPLSGKKIPVFVADFVLMSYGTGAIMGVPGHDQRDWEFAKQHKLPIIEVISGGNTEKEAYIGEGKLVNSGKFDGLPSSSFAEDHGRETMDECLSSASVDFTPPKEEKIPRALARGASLGAIQNITKYIEKHKLGRRTIQYHLRDWLVSRQRYWGTPIPMVYCQHCAKKGVGERKEMPGWFTVSESELPVLLPKIKNYTPKEGESPLARDENWVKTICPGCGGPARRETDTMDTFVCSSWYYLAYAFWHKLSKESGIRNQELGNVFKKYKELIKSWLPVDMYIGGAEHTVLHLLYSRFFTKALRDFNFLEFDEPFLALRHQGIILGEDGFKMSKSRGNVVNPDELVKKYGADTVRLYLCFMGPYDQGGPWNSKGILGVNRFLHRVWQLTQQCHPDVTSGSRRDSSPAELDQNEAVSKKEKYWLHKTIKKVTEDIQDFAFNTAVAALMEYLNFLSSQRQVSSEAIKNLVLLLAPFAPHICEELWQKKVQPSRRLDLAGAAGGWSVHQQSWPQYRSALTQEEEVTMVVEVDGKVRDKVKVKSQKSKVKSEMIAIAEKSLKVKKHLMGKKVIKTIVVPGKLVNFVTGNGRK